MADPFSQVTENETIGPNDTTDDENDVTPWPVDDFAILKLVQDKRKKAEEHLGDWYDEAVTDFQFREGRQWSEEDVDKLQNEERIAATFNRVGPIINAILGQEVCNRQEVRYLPRRAGEINAADPMNDAVKWVREQCNAEDEDSDAFADMVTCGMGWTVTRMDYESNPDGQPEIIRRDPTLMRWDPSARRKNLADMKWVQTDYWMSPEEVEDRWPNAELDGETNLSAPVERMKPHDASDAWKYKNNAAGQDRYNDEVRVIHHVQAFSVKMYRMVDPATGQMREYDERTYGQMKTAHAAMTAAAAKQGQMVPPMPDCIPMDKRVYWQAWVVGSVMLEAGQAPAQKSFPYQAMTCYRERETGYWFGVVRMMRDPQRYANRLMSLMMSILATGAKGGVLYETGAFVNPKKAKADWAKHNSAIELSPGALAATKVQAKPPQNMPPAAADLMQFAIASIRDVTGVNVDMLGGAQRDQPGVVEEMRTKAGLTILAGVFDAIRLYRKRQGILLAEFVTRFISDGRLIRVLGKAGEQFIPLIRDPENVEYDVVVDESPAARDVKERTWEALQVLVPQAAQMGVPIPDELLDYAPIPQSLSMAWKQQIAQMKAQPPQPPLPLQIEQAKQQTIMMGKQMDAQTEKEKLQLGLAAKEQEFAMSSQFKHSDQAAAMEVQRSNDERDAIRTEREYQLKREQAMMEVQMKDQEHQREQETQIRIANIHASAQVLVERVKLGIDNGEQLLIQEEKAAGYDMGALVHALTQAMAAPRELVRDPVTGKAVGTRIVMPENTTQQ